MIRESIINSLIAMLILGLIIGMCFIPGVQAIPIIAAFALFIQNIALPVLIPSIMIIGGIIGSTFTYFRIKRFIKKHVREYTLLGFLDEESKKYFIMPESSQSLKTIVIKNKNGLETISDKKLKTKLKKFLKEAKQSYPSANIYFNSDDQIVPNQYLLSYLKDRAQKGEENQSLKGILESIADYNKAQVTPNFKTLTVKGSQTIDAVENEYIKQCLIDLGWDRNEVNDVADFYKKWVNEGKKTNLYKNDFIEKSEDRFKLLSVFFKMKHVISFPDIIKEKKEGNDPKIQPKFTVFKGELKFDSSGSNGLATVSYLGSESPSPPEKSKKTIK